MLRITSIRKFLLIAIVILISLGWTISAIMIFHSSQEQIEELFDAELAQMSRILQALITSNRALHTNDLSNALEYLDKDVLAQEFTHKEYSVLGHKYEKKLAFLVWNRQGQLLIENHTQLPQSFEKLQPGFQIITSEMLAWRSFTLHDERFGLWIQVAQREDVRTELTNEIAWHSTLPSFLFLPVLMIVSGLIIRRGLSPLRIISNELKDRDYENLTSLVAASYPVELKQMVSELNSLFQRVSESYQRERRFTADAAHELRTPLSISKIHLQNIRQVSTSPKVIEFVDKALIGIERLIHMVQQLLILSRLDAGVEPDPEAPVDVVKLCHELIQETSDTPLFSGIYIQSRLPDRFEICTSETALRILLRNLLDNACRYANRDSQVEVILEGAELTIRNQCPLLEDEVLGKVFDRFARGHNSQQQGSGLGLSICQQICRQLKFTLSIQNREQTNQGKSDEGIDTCLRFTQS